MNYGTVTSALIIFCATYLIFIMGFTALLVFLTLDKKAKRKLLIFSAWVLPLAFILSRIAAYAYDNPRPFVVGGFEPLASNSTDNGFPSDHTLVSSVIAMIFWYQKRTVGIILLISAVIVGLGRVYAGVHHPIDIVGSFVISILVSSAVYWFLEKKTKTS